MSERKIIGKSRRRRTCQERYLKISELEAEVRELKHKLRVSDEYGKDMLRDRRRRS